VAQRLAKLIWRHRVEPVGGLSLFPFMSVLFCFTLLQFICADQLELCDIVLCSCFSVQFCV
jgi:hypothetical protein